MHNLPSCDADNAYCSLRYYANFLEFFTAIVARVGAGEALEQYVFSPVANKDGAHMLLRFIGGA